MRNASLLLETSTDLLRLSSSAAWGVTVVDALSTAIVMNSLDIVQPMLDHIAKIDFTTTAASNYGVSLFETNIRYLGGLLSGEFVCTSRPINMPTKKEEI